MIARTFILTYILMAMSVVAAPEELPQIDIGKSAEPNANEPTLDANPTWVASERVVINVLDKVSTRVVKSEVKLNQEVRLGSLEIYVKAAYQTSEEDKPESACFIQIYDNPKSEERKRLFSGWMFSSNPALAALEHPVYDVWIQRVAASEKPKSDASKPDDGDAVPGNADHDDLDCF